MILKYFSLKSKFVFFNYAYFIASISLLNRPIFTKDTKIDLKWYNQEGLKIEDAIISSNPERLIKLLSKTYLTQDEKKYDLNLARYISNKTNIAVNKANIFSPKLLFGLFYFINGSLFTSYNYKRFKELISEKEKLIYKSGIFAGLIVSFIGFEKIYKALTKNDKKKKRTNAYAVEALIKNLKENDFENN